MHDVVDRRLDALDDLGRGPDVLAAAVVEVGLGRIDLPVAHQHVRLEVVPNDLLGIEPGRRVQAGEVQEVGEVGGVAATAGEVADEVTAGDGEGSDVGACRGGP